jgi:hypothetical protein
MECTRDKFMQRSSQVVELGNAKRYRLNAPAVYWWAGAEDLPERGSGITQDISSSGVFVLTTELPPLAAHIEVEVSLPGVGNGSPGVRLKGDGFVCRLQRGPTGPVGFAAVVQFCPEHPDLAAVCRCGSANLLQ